MTLTWKECEARLREIEEDVEDGCVCEDDAEEYKLIWTSMANHAIAKFGYLLDDMNELVGQEPCPFCGCSQAEGNPDCQGIQRITCCEEVLIEENPA